MIPTLDTPHPLHARFAALPAPREGDRFVLSPGSAADYAALSAHHYRAARPATMIRIFTMRDPAATVADRFRGHEPLGRAVAVLIESLPTLSCKLRNAALGGRYAALEIRQRGKLLNAEVRCISRVVVDPRYRGLGLAVRLVKHALSTATTVYTEALAAMGAVSPFFEKAGMAAYQRAAHAHDARLLAALERCGVGSAGLARAGDIAALAGHVPVRDRAWLLHELRRWYCAAEGRAAGRSEDPGHHLDAARRYLFSRPVYYLCDNRGVAD